MIYVDMDLRDGGGGVDNKSGGIKGVGSGYTKSVLIMRSIFISLKRAVNKYLQENKPTNE
jgi:hypothetical protein